MVVMLLVVLVAAHPGELSHLRHYDMVEYYAGAKQVRLNYRASFVKIS